MVGDVFAATFNESLDWLATEWVRLSPTERNQHRAYLLAGGWFGVCHSAVCRREKREIEDWIEERGHRADLLSDAAESQPDPAVGAFHRAQIRAHLLCAAAALESDPARRDGLLGEAARKTGYPPAFYEDLLGLLRADSPRSASPKAQRLGVLLVQGSGIGLAARLVMHRIPGGTGTLYPAPSEGFRYRGPAFVAAEQAARDYARSHAKFWKDDSDVRWALENGAGGGRNLIGSSMGAAFAVALQFLFTKPCDLSAFAVTAAVDAGGGLSRVKHLGEKVQAAKSADPPLRGVLAAGAEAGFEGGFILYEPSVPSACRRLGRLLPRPRRALACRAAATVGALAALWIACSLVLMRFVYSYSFRGAQRVFVTQGLPYPLAPHRDVNTGFILRDFSSYAISGLLQKGNIWSSRADVAWGPELARALQPSMEKAAALRRLGLTEEAEAALKPLLRSDSSKVSGPAAIMLFHLDPAARSAALPAMEAQFDGYARIRSGGEIQTGQAVMDMDPPKTPYVDRLLGALSFGGPNRYVDVAALRVMASDGQKDHGQAKYWLTTLARDPDDEIAARAAQALFELDPTQPQETLSVVVPLLLKPESRLNAYAYDAVASVGQAYPDLTERTLEAAGLSATGELAIEQFDTDPNPLRTLQQTAATRNAADLRQAVADINDQALPNRLATDHFTRFVGFKIAVFARRDHAPTEQYLLQQMRSPLADRSAIYRNACGYALAMTTPEARRMTVRAELTRMWLAERRPEIKVALAIAVEQLSNLYGLKWET